MLQADLSAAPDTEDGHAAEVNADEGLETAVERVLKRYFDAHDDLPPPPGLYDRVLREVEGRCEKDEREVGEGRQFYYMTAGVRSAPLVCACCPCVLSGWLKTSQSFA